MKRMISSITAAVLPFILAIGAFATEVTDSGEVVEDGINTNVATVWIICISAVVSAVIITIAVILARRNRGTK